MLSRIDEGDGLLAAFVKYDVKWHKSCRNKFSSRELQRKTAAFESACLSTLDSSELGESSDDVPCKRRCTRADLDSGTSSHKRIDVCFFCDQPLDDQSGHSVETFGVDHKVRECALALADSKLLAKLATSDLMAIEAKYHKNCLTSLYNRRRSLERTQYSAFAAADHTFDYAHGLVFARLHT